MFNGVVIDLENGQKMGERTGVRIMIGFDGEICLAVGGYITHNQFVPNNYSEVVLTDKEAFAISKALETVCISKVNRDGQQNRRG